MIDLWENAISLKNINNPKVEEKIGSNMDLNTAYNLILQIYSQFKEEHIEKIHNKISTMKEPFYSELIKESKIINLSNKKDFEEYYKLKISALEARTIGINKKDLIS